MHTTYITSCVSFVDNRRATSWISSELWRYVKFMIFLLTGLILKYNATHYQMFIKQ